jgi:nucleotide-binding universal stress UspA family protein
VYKQIVVGTDGSPTAEVAVGQATTLAKLTGATLHIVNAFRAIAAHQIAAAPEAMTPPIDVNASNEASREAGLRICEAAVEVARQEGVTAEAHCVADDPADALVNLADQLDADLIVVGNRGMSGVKRFLLGSVPNKVSHHCPCNLLVVNTTA